MLFCQKRPKTNFPPICFQSLWKRLQTTFLVSFYPIHKVLGNLKFWPKSQGVSPCFLAKNAPKKNFLQFASNHSENDSKHHFSSPFYLYRKFWATVKFWPKSQGVSPCFLAKKRPKTNFPPICFQSLWKLLQTTFLVSFYPYTKF